MSDEVREELHRLDKRVAVLEAHCDHQRVRQDGHDSLFDVVLARTRALSDQVHDHYSDLHDEVDQVRREFEENLKEIRSFMLKNGWGLVVLLLTTLVGIIVTLVTK